jgi:endo-alpha-1,4-polygalactosaminidase (GH114 family)
VKQQSQNNKITKELTSINSKSPTDYLDKESISKHSENNAEQSMISFLQNIEAHIILAMLPLVTIIRQVTPVPLETAFINGRHSFPVGCTVFYLSSSEHHSESIQQGMVVKLHQSGSFIDVVRMNNTLDRDIHIRKVRYTSKPLFSFKTVSDLTVRSLEDIHLFRGNIFIIFMVEFISN